MIRFEEMKARPVEMLLGVCSHLGIGADRDKVEIAVGEASLDNAREIEQARISKDMGGDASFYRGGRTGQWKKYFTPAIESHFWDISRNSMRLAGYDE